MYDVNECNGSVFVVEVNNSEYWKYQQAERQPWKMAGEFATPML